MIDGIGKAGAGRLETVRTSIERSAPAAKVADATSQRQVRSPLNPAASMAVEGAPVDGGKVAAIRQAIAEGRYPVDPDKIAASMIALDLPGLKSK